MTGLGGTVVAVDVETTGFHSRDRMVSLGAWRLDLDDEKESLRPRHLYLILDPGKKSHPRAEQVHGYSDWALRHQDPFSDHAMSVSAFLAGSHRIVAHNASFDLKFIEREYALLGQTCPQGTPFCTMETYRARSDGRATLNAVCTRMGLSRGGEKHGALEDAWLALMAYFWLHDAPGRIRPFERMLREGAPSSPTNYREPPPLPDGPLPRRRKQAAAAPPPPQADNRFAPAKAALLAAVQPTAVLLLEIARADEYFAPEEVDILVNLLRATRDRLGVRLDGEAEMDVLADLFDLQLSPALLARSAESLCADPVARREFPRWFATLVRADGTVSDGEQAGIDRVKAAIAEAMK
jgi:DNA polymerase-3 subunit epsilon